jgi:acyl-CoA reductase-like NAD-dependent aldehyde dehydrogenase
LGNPLDEEVTLGPMVRAANANRARIHVQEALAQGAQALIDEKLFPESKVGLKEEHIT